jgi:hypothetical protein
MVRYRKHWTYSLRSQDIWLVHDVKSFRNDKKKYSYMLKDVKVFILPLGKALNKN